MKGIGAHKPRSRFDFRFETPAELGMVLTTLITKKKFNPRQLWQRIGTSEFHAEQPLSETGGCITASREQPPCDDSKLLFFFAGVLYFLQECWLSCTVAQNR